LQHAWIKLSTTLCSFSYFLTRMVLSLRAGSCGAIGGAWHGGLGGCNL
jgi:hypothetical protein